MYSTRLFADIIDCLTHRSSAIRAQAELMSEFGTLNFSHTIHIYCITVY